MTLSVCVCVGGGGGGGGGYDGGVYGGIMVELSFAWTPAVKRIFFFFKDL